MKMKLILTVIFLINITIIISAYAYVDPNTGGFFFQTVAPFVYGILGVLVVFWKRITGFFKGLFIRNQNQGDNTKK